MGGVEAFFAVGAASGAGGVGRGGGAGAPFGRSDALESWRGRDVPGRMGRCWDADRLGEFTTTAPWLVGCARIVGDEVCCLAYLGRWRRVAAPGEGKGGTCPVWRTDIDLVCSGSCRICA